MTQPGRGELGVATDALRSEANVWEDQSERIGSVSSKAEGLRLSRLEAGIFQLIVSPYEAVVDLTVARCQEGQRRMTEIASTLRKVADTYDEEERNNEHRIRNVY